jgi:hypothetical protein
MPVNEYNKHLWENLIIENLEEFTYLGIIKRTDGREVKMK